MKKTICVLFFSFFFFNANISAQSFLKKIAKGIENAGKEIDKVTKEVDKQLGTEEKTEETAKTDISTSQTKPDNSKANTSTVIHPYISDKTKVVQMNNTKQFRFDYTDFSDGVAFVKDADKKRWAMIDTEGNFLSGFVFNFENLTYGKEPIPYYNSGVCITTSRVYPYEDKNKLANALILDKKGAVVKAIPNVSSYTNFSDGIAHIRTYLRDPKKSSSYRTEYYYKYIYIDTKGEVIYPHLTVDVYPTNDGRDIPGLAPLLGLSEGLRAYWSYKTGWGFINEKGEIVVKPAYRNVHSFKNGYAAVQDWNKNWGFIDKTGKLVIAHTFSEEPSDFQDGLAIVRKRNGDDCYIDTSGNVVLDKINEQGINNLGLFFNGKAFVTCYIGHYNGMAIGVGTIVLDRDLKHYKVLYPDPGVNGKNIVGYKNGRYYFKDGSIMNESYQMVRYDEDGYNSHPNPFRNGLAKFQYDKNPKSSTNPYKCYIAETGEIKIIFKEPEF